MIFDKYNSCEDDECECECHACETHYVPVTIGCMTPENYRRGELLRTIYEPMLKKQLESDVAIFKRIKQ